MHNYYFLKFVIFFLILLHFVWILLIFIRHVPYPSFNYPTWTCDQLFEGLVSPLLQCIHPKPFKDNHVNTQFSSSISEQGELYTTVAAGLAKGGVLRFPMTEGLAGHVATTGSSLNIEDAHEDKRFNRDIDKKTGYRTKVCPWFLCFILFLQYLWVYTLPNPFERRLILHFCGYALQSETKKFGFPFLSFPLSSTLLNS